MIKLARISLIFALIIVPLAILNAQDDEIVEDIAYGTFIMPAESGSLVEAADDLFTLTLEGVPESLQWFINVDAIGAGQYLSIEFSSDWSFASQEELLVAEAVLLTENETVTLMIFEPNYFDGVFSYAAQVISIEPFDETIEADKADLPETFDSATLFIPLFPEFATGLQVGMEAREASMRGSGMSNPCRGRFPNC